MCMSPHEMTSARIEEIIASSKEILEDEKDPWYQEYYQDRLEHLEALLKERAEDGTYATAGI